MIRHGEVPYLECSSAGDRRFSALYAYVSYNGWLRSIENIYQSSKILEDGRTNLSFREAKGKKAVNREELKVLYSHLWDLYIEQNPDLVHTLLEVKGLSDKFGQKGHVCQATELWRIRERLLREKAFENWNE